MFHLCEGEFVVRDYSHARHSLLLFQVACLLQPGPDISNPQLGSQLREREGSDLLQHNSLPTIVMHVRANKLEGLEASYCEAR